MVMLVPTVITKVELVNGIYFPRAPLSRKWVRVALMHSIPSQFGFAASDMVSAPVSHSKRHPHLIPFAVFARNHSTSSALACNKNQRMASYSVHRAVGQGCVTSHLVPFVIQQLGKFANVHGNHCTGKCKHAERGSRTTFKTHSM